MKVLITKDKYLFTDGYYGNAYDSEPVCLLDVDISEDRIKILSFIDKNNDILK